MSVFGFRTLRSGYLLVVMLIVITECRPQDLTWSAAIQEMEPYEGMSVIGVDTTTLHRKTVVGYQGWFNTPGDGAGLDWKHYAGRDRRFLPGSCSIDFWPDVTELDEDEKYATPFTHADDQTAFVFSSRNRKTILRHFRWMKEYGIEAAFVQRFASAAIRDPSRFNNCNQVLANCREGANLSGRAYIVMYDLSGLNKGEISRAKEDWRRLVRNMGITKGSSDRAYLHHKGQPLVAVWGIGFADGRKYTLDECEEFVDFLKNDPDYGGCTVMLGVPTGWRTLDRDCVNEAKVHEIISLADIVSPWTPGRYRSLREVETHADKYWKEDLAWCTESGKDYLPVVFPGFSWHNLKRAENAPFDHIPRLGGRFLWKQYSQLRRLGIEMAYQAMFDEMDEGTQIFKITNNPPIGESPFLTYEGLPSDHYLWLVGQAGKMLKKEIPLLEDLPQRQ